MRRTGTLTGTLAVAAIFAAAPASAQVVQSLQLGVGAFVPTSEGARSTRDVLVTDITQSNLNPFPLFFDVHDFSSGHVFAEWNVAFGNHLEVAAGVGYYARTVPSVYAGRTFLEGREIAQDLSWRVVPLSAVVRFLPFGRLGEFQPYAGAGVTALPWRYAERGQFVDFADETVYNARYQSSGTAAGLVVLGGVRIPIHGDVYALAIEVRHQTGSGELDSRQFLSDRIDLGGTFLNVGWQVRF